MIMQQRIVFSQNLQRELADAIAESGHDKLFVLTDDNTRRLCWPVVSHFLSLKHAQLISIPPTDNNKTVDSLCHVWQELQQGGATRHSCVVNLGGGMLTDLGGFAASTFKRGIDFINLPTTLLAMVDASVGGKTGINFGGLKNEVGVFSNARCVIIDARFLQTLDAENICSGYAEMIKHALISDDHHWAQLLQFPLHDATLPQHLSTLQQLVAQSVEVKRHIVDEDPREKGIRKALNLGHTVGHAIEAFAMQQPKPIIRYNDAPVPCLHGYAVAFGLICELYLSCIKTGFPTHKLQQTAHFIREHYGSVLFSCNDYDALIELMTHDKKNLAGSINFTLLADIGDIRINQTATNEEIKQSLDFLREA